MDLDSAVKTGDRELLQQRMAGVGVDRAGVVLLRRKPLRRAVPVLHAGAVQRGLKGANRAQYRIAGTNQRPKKQFPERTFRRGFIRARR